MPSVINERDKIIESQRERLHDIDQWAKRLRGPCVACRWAEGGADYAHCMNPVVTRATVNPVSGQIAWEGPKCRWERMAEYPERNDYGGKPDARWRGRTLCGPEGLLFEPRTREQFITLWSLRLAVVLPLLGIASCVVAGLAHG